MKTEYLYSRKHNGEEYKFYACTPSYDGEKGILGMEIEPYVIVNTPDNGLGYPDTVLLNNGKKAYTLNRYLQPWILKKIEKQMVTAQEKIAYDYYTRQGEKRQAKLAFYED